MHAARFIVSMVVVGCSLPCFAQQNATLEVTQAALNKLAGQLGAIGDSGFYQPTKSVVTPSRFAKCVSVGYLDCPGDPAGRGAFGKVPLVRCIDPAGSSRIVPAADPVAWQWSVQSATFTISSGSMTFNVALQVKLGTQTTTINNSAHAYVSFDQVANRVRLSINPLTVPIDYLAAGRTYTITTVDLAQLYSFSIPIDPQAITLQMPGGATRTLTAHALSVIPQYQSGKVVLAINVGF